MLTEHILAIVVRVLTALATRTIASLSVLCQRVGADRSGAHDLLSMSLWRGTAVVTSAEFAEWTERETSVPVPLSSGVVTRAFGLGVRGAGYQSGIVVQAAAFTGRTRATGQ